MKLTIFWFRRDLRLEDNAGLYHALKGPDPVLPVFIFDKNILDDLADKADRRVQFIHDQIKTLQSRLGTWGSDLLTFYDNPLDVFKALLNQYEVGQVITNRDYEPYAKQRDQEIGAFLAARNIKFTTFKDQVIFEQKEVVKDNLEPYTMGGKTK